MARLVNISDVCSEIFAGGDAPQNNISTEKTDKFSVPIYSNGEAKNGLYGYTNFARVTKPSVTISARGTIGFAAIRSEPFVPIVRLITLTPDPSLIDIRYLYYAVQNYHFDENGTSIPQLTVPMLKKYVFPLPDLSDQLHIATTLDKLSCLISLRKQQLAKLDELVKARFVEMFGDPVQNKKTWKTYSLDSVCTSIVDCPHSTPSYTSENTGYMCIRTSIVKKNQILWDKIEYIPENEYYQRIQRKRPEKGDIVYTREGAILGIAAMIDKDCNVALGQRSMLLSPNPVYCCSQFLCAAMNFDTFLSKALEGLGGSASPHINVGDIKSFQIIVPPIELQEQFVKFVEKNKEQKLTIQQSLDKLEVLKKSLMQEYFG